MPRCQWCGKFEKDIHRLDNGATVLVLCDMCAAQKAVRDEGPLKVEDLVQPTLWDRVRRLFRGR